MNKTSDILKEILNEAMKQGVSILATKFAEQGHTLTGALTNTIRYSVRRKGRVIVAQMTLLKYGLYVNNGVAASKIPFGGTGNRGGGGTSKYIQGLIRFWRQRGLPEAEAKKAAFATARKHKQEGMPTKASRRFSKTGKRTGALDEAAQEIEDLIFKEIADGMEEAVTGVITNLFRGNSKHVKYTTNGR